MIRLPAAQTYRARLISELLPVVVVAAGVFALAVLCLETPRLYGRVSPVWFADGLAAAFLLRSPLRRWPSLAAAGLVGGLAANLFTSDALSLGIGLALCHTLQILVCAGLVRRSVGRDFDVSRWRDLAVFAVAAAIAAALGGACAAAMVSTLTGGDFLRDMALWTTAGGLGLLVVTPALVSLSHIRDDLAKQPLTNVGVAALVAFGGVVVLAFGQHRYPLTFIVPAALIVTSLGAERLGATIGLMIVALVGVVMAGYGDGPLNLLPGSLLDRAVMVQIFLVTCTLCSLPVAAYAMGRRRLNERLQQAREDAEAAAKAKSEFLANMSHELRTPLTSILGFTKLAAEQAELGERSRGYVERVRVASEALLATVNDILDFSKLEGGQVTFRPRPVAPAGLARSALALFGPQAEEKGLALTLDCDCPGEMMVSVDPDRLRQILLNLIGNAVKFTQDGGVTLGVRHVENRLHVAVSDTGAGIPAERLGELFRRFSQIDGSSTRTHGGTGLGLAICKGLAEAMGGRIGVESELGRGSRFWFEIPAPTLQSQARPEAQSEGVQLADGLRVLVVDDNPANRELVDLILTAVGVEVAQADDGRSAVQLCAEAGFDLVLMDLRMPGMGGEEAMQRIRAQGGPNASTPILAFTADVYQDDAAEARLQGFDGRLAKPIRPEELLQAVAAATSAEPEPIPLGAPA